jgi:hypothetical protein
LIGVKLSEGPTRKLLFGGLRIAVVHAERCAKGELTDLPDRMMATEGAST